MKKIFSMIVLAAVASVNAQVIIGDAVGTVLPAAQKTSVLLEFANTSDRGIIVPYVRALPTLAALVPGVIVLDAVDATKARMRYFAGADGWKDLSNQPNDADVSALMTTQPTGITETGAKAIIGAQTSSADGVLVLESATKAMVLPSVNNTDQIINPSPGMLVYINKTGAKRLAVFNGSKWSYWKP